MTIGHLFYNHKHLSLDVFIEQCIMIVENYGYSIDRVEVRTGENVKNTICGYAVVGVENVLKNHVYIIHGGMK